MLRISTLLMMLLPPAHGVEISYFDSVTNPKLSWVLVDDCAVPVLRSKVKDECYVMQRVNNFCHLDLKLEKCNGTK